MIIDKSDFKSLLKDGGNVLLSPHSVAKFEFGYKEIKCGATLNLYIMSNGVFADITFGKKIYISYDSINDVEVNGSKLIIFVNEDDKDKQIVFKVQNMRAIDKMFNTIRQNAELEYRGIEDTNINSEPLQSKSTTYVNIENEQIEPKSTQRDRVKELKRERIANCPKCHSTSIEYVEHRKQLSVGRGVVGGVLLGPAGAVLGGLTSKKYKGNMKCLNCGHAWKK
ncbi:hypothetical protein [Clostridium butyricum]|uniref:hypothetical protein n=1 Tax=Clostridium butyricum TaxID=1492 RepID=UPI00374F3DCB